MRDIKFRGMCANGTMRYGRLSQDKENETLYYKEYSQRICWDNSNIPVSNKTLGQFTGLLDKNGKEIYEGDIFFAKMLGDSPIGHNVKVVYEAPYFDLEDKKGDRFWNFYGVARGEVIGNIYENPNLLNK